LIGRKRKESSIVILESQDGKKQLLVKKKITI